MSKTARDTITRAMRMLGVIIGGTDPSDVESSNGLLALNAMMHGWKGKGVDIGHIDLDINDDLDVADEHCEGTTALLAIALAPEFTVSVSAAVGVLASEGWSSLQAAYITNDITRDMTVETGLRRLGANRRGGWYVP